MLKLLGQVLKDFMSFGLVQGHLRDLKGEVSQTLHNRDGSCLTSLDNSGAVLCKDILLATVMDQALC